MNPRAIMDAGLNTRRRARAQARAEAAPLAGFVRPRRESKHAEIGLVELLKSLGPVEPEPKAEPEPEAETEPETDPEPADSGTDGSAAPQAEAREPAQAHAEPRPEPAAPSEDAPAGASPASEQVSEPEPAHPAAPSQMLASASPNLRIGAAKPPQIFAKRRRLNERQERFCEEYVAVGNGAKAARYAGYGDRCAYQQASRLLTKANILQRIAGLRSDLGAKNRIDRETLMAKLEACYCSAFTCGNYHAAVRAAEAQARLAGLMKDGRKRPHLRELAQPPGRGKDPAPAPETRVSSHE